MGTGVLLVHGYTGSGNDLELLEKKLAAEYGSGNVVNLVLPGHTNGQTPDFDLQAFEQTIIGAVSSLQKKASLLVIFGHSTGGSLVLSVIHRYGVRPDLLILFGIPGRVNAASMERWETHWKSRKENPTPPDFTALCRMVSLINSVGKRKYENNFPVILLNGSEDKMVLPDTALEWQRNFRENVRIVLLPETGHHFSPGSLSADRIAGTVIGAVHDISRSAKRTEHPVLKAIIKAEPGIRGFLSNSPRSAYHLAGCPSACRLAGTPDKLADITDRAPVFANIEITTHCNLSCRFCMRTRKGLHGEHMSSNLFRRILERLHHAYRVTFVGLGEPLLHPEIKDFIALAKDQGRHTALVTNGLALDRKTAEKLIRTGLDSIVFSIDAPNQALAGRLRSGTDLERVVANIKCFTDMERTAGRQMSKAAFTALSMASLHALDELVDLVAGLGVDVLMLSDLNFLHNSDQALFHNIDTGGKEAVRNSLKRAFARNFPVLSVHGIEAFGLRSQYHRFLALPPARLYTRSLEHTHCVSPWQTLPVNVHGQAYLCDCQPGVIAGNLISDPFDNIWNSPLFQNHRRRLAGGNASETCRHCPRF